MGDVMYGLIAKPVLWYLDHGPVRWQPPMIGVLAYLGPRSRKRVRLAVLPMAIDGHWVVTVANHERKSWWKAFRSPLEADLVIARVRHSVTGRLLAGDERSRWAQAYLDQFPRGKPRLDVNTPVVLLTPKPD